MASGKSVQRFIAMAAGFLIAGWLLAESPAGAQFVPGFYLSPQTEREMIASKAVSDALWAVYRRQVDAAEKRIAKARTIVERLPDSVTKERFRLMVVLAESDWHNLRDDKVTSLRLAQKAYQESRRLFGATDTSTVETELTLASQYMERGRLAEARGLLLNSQAVLENHNRKLEAGMTGQCYQLLGALDYALGNIDHAEEYHPKALNAYRQSDKAYRWLVPHEQAMYAAVLRVRGRCAESDALFAKAIVDQDHSRGPDWQYRALLLNYAFHQMIMGNYRQAAAITSAVSLAQSRDRSIVPSTQRAALLCLDAEIALREGNADAALPLLEQASSLLFNETYGQSQDAADTVRLLAEAHLIKGDVDRSKEESGKALDLYLATVKDGGRVAPRFYNTVGRVAHAKHDEAAAEESFLNALAAARKWCAEGNLETARTMVFYADSLEAQGRADEAKKMRDEAGSIRARCGFGKEPAGYKSVLKVLPKA